MSISKSTKLSETVIIFFYLLSMKCSTLLMSKSKVRIGVGIGISQLIIACCLACSAALWTVDLIQLWRYNSFLNENDPMGSGKSYIKNSNWTLLQVREMYDFGFCLIMTWFNCAIFGFIGIFMIVIWILPVRYRQRLRRVFKFVPA